MTYDEVEEILNSNLNERNDYDKSIVKDPLLVGLTIISNLSTKRNYAAEHDKFYASDFDDMPDMTSWHVLMLNRLGWFIDREYNCWVIYV